jgi:hypothetical protein
MDLMSDSLSIEFLLLLSKRLDPLSAVQIETVQHIQDYRDVEDLNEAGVRTYIIDPMLRALGYDHGTPYSTSLENPLVFLGQKRRSDYHAQLWKENFWLMEAKKPQPNKPAFGYDDFSQALEYSVHPTVNAALIALCDGLKLEIFDREVSVENPILHVDIKKLVADFDKVRTLLGPMQVWFFQKRRVIRLLDRVFNKEFVLDRVEEFSTLVHQRLTSKSNIAIQNRRQLVDPGSDDERRQAESASLVDITEMYMMYDYPIPIANAVNRRLVELSMPSSFQVMLRVLPDRPRLANDSYMSQTAAYLVSLAEKRDTAEYLPSWLSPGHQAGAPLVAAVKRFLDRCLTYFKDYEPYRLVLLAAWAIRRFAKINAVALGAIQKLGADLHALARHSLPETSWAQVLASPELQLLGIIDTSARTLLDDFIRKNTAEDGSFKLESAKLQLQGYWSHEKRLLAALPNYSTLLKERSLHDPRLTESASITYDNLGHYTIVRLHAFPKWKTYLLEERRELVEQVASTGSWAARELLGLPKEEEPYRRMSDEDLAARFFLGDVGILRDLRQAYQRP